MFNKIIFKTFIFFFFFLLFYYTDYAHYFQYDVILLPRQRIVHFVWRGNLRYVYLAEPRIQALWLVQRGSHLRVVAQGIIGLDPRTEFLKYKRNWDKRDSELEKKMSLCYVNIVISIFNRTIFSHFLIMITPWQIVSRGISSYLQRLLNQPIGRKRNSQQLL
jgi:hypothetical protein